MRSSLSRPTIKLDPAFRTVATVDAAPFLKAKGVRVLRAGAAEAKTIPFRRSVRIVNVLVAVVGLIVCAPLMLVIALAIRLSSPGPVFFTQRRVGLDRRRGDQTRWRDVRRVDHGGRLFTIYKFRTMRVQPAVAREVWATPGDARITAIGRVLRRYRLDELPQLINVVKGDMNIVGPRPEQPAIFQELREQIDDYPIRQRVLPGITGWAQINHCYDRSIEDVRTKLRYDLEYLERLSPLEDVRIMLRTVPVMFFQRGGW